jgi:hypothetical protein
VSNKLLILIFFVFHITDCFSDNSTFNNILNGIFHEQDRIDKEIQDATFDGNFSYIEINNKGDTIKTIYSKRRVFTRGYDKQKSEYSEMIKNGKTLTQVEIQKELKNNRSDTKTKLPFDIKERNNYEFNYLSDEKWNDFAVWKIGFKPKKKGKDFVDGFVYVSKSDSNVVQYQFKPIGLPFVVKNFNISLDYMKIQNYWVPEKFSLKIEIDVKVIFSFAHKYIEMREEYSNYKFNNGLEDSFFQVK